MDYVRSSADKIAYFIGDRGGRWNILLPLTFLLPLRSLLLVTVGLLVPIDFILLPLGLLLSSTVLLPLVFFVSDACY